MRPFVRRSGALLGVWLAGVALLIGIGIRAVHLLTATTSAAALEVHPTTYSAQVSDIEAYSAFYRQFENPSAVQWPAWLAAVTAGVVMALMAILAVLGGREGLGSRRVLRLLALTGLTALAGGVAVVLADPIAGHTGGFARYWSGEDAWLLAIGLLVLGGALLAVRTVAGRVAALHRELDGVI